MPRTDEGEFELILGNRQLISVFLIVVILLGVFFSMGYIVGRNSAPVAVESRNATPSKPIVVETPRTAAKESEPPPIEPAPPAAPPESKPVPDTKPAAITPAPPEPKAEVKPEPKKAPPKQEPAAEPVETKKREPATSATVSAPPSGRYWQVVSTGKHEAEIIAGAIAKKGMHALVAPAPKEGYFRVLVGPLGDASETAKTRSSLEAAGFKGPILAKY